MPTKEELETMLYERMSAENEAYLADLKTKLPEDIIFHSYATAVRSDILLLFEDETPLNPKQLEALLEYEHPLEELFEDWTGRDCDELDHLRDSIEACADDILKERAEKKYSDPAQPVYGRAWKEAYARCEVPEWEADRRRSEKCAEAFRTEGAAAYHEQTFPAFLQKWEAEFGRERCMFVLACAMRQRESDGRFFPPARQAAVKFKRQLERIGNEADDYAVNTHSCIVNNAMEYLARPECGKEQIVAREKQQRER